MKFLESLDPHLDFTDWIVLLQIKSQALVELQLRCGLKVRALIVCMFVHPCSSDFRFNSTFLSYMHLSYQLEMSVNT